MDSKEDQLNSLLEDALDDLLIVNESPKGPRESSAPKESNDFKDDPAMDKFFADMKRQLDEINPEEAQAKISESVPEIFDLMQNLLSKELLYPALKDLSPKFEEWMEKNAETLSKAEKRRYKKQMDIINEIIEVFDNDSLDNQERFVKNLELMEKMQSLGAPPSELTVPEGMGKCSIM